MLGLPATDLCIKFEISTFIHYKDMKGDENAKILVAFGVLGVTKNHQNTAEYSIEHIQLSI